MVLGPVWSQAEERPTRESWGPVLVFGWLRSRMNPWDESWPKLVKISGYSIDNLWIIYGSGWWWLEHDLFSLFYWEFHHPNWLSYFSKGLKPPTRYGRKCTFQSEQWCVGFTLVQSCLPWLSCIFSVRLPFLGGMRKVFGWSIDLSIFMKSTMNYPHQAEAVSSWHCFEKHQNDQVTSPIVGQKELLKGTVVTLTRTGL